EKIKNSLPELPIAKRQRFQQEYGFSVSEANIIIPDEQLANYTEKIISELRAWLISSENSEGDEEEIWQKNKKELTKLVSNWLINRLLGLLKRHKTPLADLKITPENFAQFIVILSQRHFSSSLGQQILEQMFISGQDPEQIINEQNIQQVDDQLLLEEIVQQIIDANPVLVKQYRQGKTVIIKFLVGQAMKQTKGRADPQLVEQLLIKSLTE
ncbi:MAG: Asp-tRNA(Asn)/Glu-tRNA(Gln) amidotransferase subunit GatB, partial [Candidatus Aenigmarchaeota archaeon]|nr:Asp-tRNA(Asn)/Glu-tRNA(Gln) amidotransferase subunit GatB [Candidatus Aenigmarchaeota archaeon]